MSGGTRFQLKQPTGWFAAGREVACALELLSDATFKLFVWLCLHAERSRGALSVTSAELARALGKKESDMHLALEELERQGVCTLRAEGLIEIRDRFWPYQCKDDSAASDEARRYVAEVKRLFLERRCVQSSFTAADEKLALSLFRRRVSLIHVERAILLGAVRKYAAVHENGHSTNQGYQGSSKVCVFQCPTTLELLCERARMSGALSQVETTIELTNRICDSVFHRSIKTATDSAIASPLAPAMSQDCAFVAACFSPLRQAWEAQLEGFQVLLD